MNIKEKIQSINENRAEYIRNKKRIERMPTETIRQKIFKMIKGAESLNTADAKLYQILIDVYKTRVDDAKFFNTYNKI